jgi:hypothetical protein
MMGDLNYCSSARGKGDKDVKKEFKNTSQFDLDFSEKNLLSKKLKLKRKRLKKTYLKLS